MLKELSKDVLDPEDRAQILRDSCDAIEQKGYMVAYTPEELDRMKSELSDVAIQINDIEEEKKAIMAEFTDRLKPLTEDKKALLKGLKEKAYYTKADCFRFTDQNSRMTGYYTRDGSLIEARPATVDELQSTVFQEIRKTGTNN